MKRFLICFVLLAVFLCGCSAPVSAPEPTPSLMSIPIPSASFDIDGYKTLVSECQKAIMDYSILLSNMGQYEHKYWEALENIGGRIDYDNMRESAKKWLYEEAKISEEDFEKNYKNIENLYKQIIGIDILEDYEAEFIKEKIDELFESFAELYLLVTAPSGSIDDFADNFNEYSRDIKYLDMVLSTTLSE